jgi:uncharacterized protein YuzE
MKTTYDRVADAAYIEFVDVAPGEAVAQQEVPVDDKESTIVLDFDQNGFLLGVEILGASSILREELLAKATDITGDS